MAFAVARGLIIAADSQFRIRLRQRLHGVLVFHLRFAREHVESDTFNTRRGSGEVPVDQRFVQSDGLEYLRAAIALQRGDAHLREDFEQSFIDGLLVILERRLKVDAAGQ